MRARMCIYVCANAVRNQSACKDLARSHGYESLTLVSWDHDTPPNTHTSSQSVQTVCKRAPGLTLYCNAVAPSYAHVRTLGWELQWEEEPGGESDEWSIAINNQTITFTVCLFLGKRSQNPFLYLVIVQRSGFKNCQAARHQTFNMQWQRLNTCHIKITQPLLKCFSN